MGWMSKALGAENKEQKFLVAELPPLPSIANPMHEMQDFSMQLPIERKIQPFLTESREIPELPKQEMHTRIKIIKEEKDFVFVRLDKFEESEDNLKEIKSKLGDINSNIKEVDLITDKEYERLFAWSKDLEKIKLLLNKVDAKVFSQF